MVTRVTPQWATSDGVLAVLGQPAHLVTGDDAERLDRVVDAVNWLIGNEWHPEWVSHAASGGPFANTFAPVFSTGAGHMYDGDAAAVNGANELAGQMWRSVNSGTQEFGEFDGWRTTSIASFLTPQISAQLRLGRWSRVAFA